MTRFNARSSARVAVTALFAVAVAACSAPGSSPPAGAVGSSGGSGGGSGSSGGGSGSSSGGVSTDTGPVSLPFVVSDEFVPSGFMGDAPTDFNAIKMSSDSTQCMTRQTGAQGACYTISWTPAPLTGAKSAWVGVYWQYPSNNWGAKVGRTIAPGATKITFLAAGAAGGEEVEFLAGGVNAAATPGLTYADTFSANTTATLTTAWTQYEISLSGDSYESVIGGFAWTITTSSTTPVTFYIDDIEWE